MHNFTYKLDVFKIIVLASLCTFTICSFPLKAYGEVFEPNTNQVNPEAPKKDENSPQEEKKEIVDPKEQFKSEIERIYNQRNAALVTGDAETIKENFDTSQKHGQWALEHEAKRIQYFNQWAQERNMVFKNIESIVRIKKLYPGTQITKAAIEESYRFDYIYKDDETIVNSFGVGIRHTITLKNKGEKWVVSNDWYTDCFEDALQGYTGFIQGRQTSIIDRLPNRNFGKQAAFRVRAQYNREKAVEYADKYCGAAWGSTNDFKYNKKYRDYNGIGGDCTNFASQVLGDKEAGGLKQDGTWRCPLKKYGYSEGSRAWVNADGLKDYLVHSGRGSVISKGTYKQLTTPSPNMPAGAISKIQLGDLICYEKKGQIDHFAIVTGFDSKGYPLVNSHTTDRYHVPWDLGWGDKHIRFFLLHINAY